MIVVTLSYKVLTFPWKIRKHFKSVFLQCFSFAPPCNLCWWHKICVLEAKNAFEIFQKHFLRPGRNFASSTMFPHLRWPLRLPVWKLEKRDQCMATMVHRAFEIRNCFLVSLIECDWLVIVEHNFLAGCHWNSKNEPPPAPSKIFKVPRGFVKLICFALL